MVEADRPVLVTQLLTSSGEVVQPRLERRVKPAQGHPGYGCDILDTLYRAARRQPAAARPTPASEDTPANAPKTMKGTSTNDEGRTASGPDRRPITDSGGASRSTEAATSSPRASTPSTTSTSSRRPGRSRHWMMSGSTAPPSSQSRPLLRGSATGQRRHPLHLGIGPHRRRRLWL